MVQMGPTGGRGWDGGGGSGEKWSTLASSLKKGTAGLMYGLDASRARHQDDSWVFGFCRKDR